MNKIYKTLLNLYFRDNLLDQKLPSIFSDINANTILEVAHEERIFLDIYKFLSLHGICCTISNEFSARYKNYEGDHINYRSVIERIIYKGLGDKIILVKGASVSLLYPPDRERYSADLDLIVRDFGAVHEVAKVSKSFGYELNSTVLLAMNEQRELFGAVRLDDEDMWPRGIDLQINHFPITAASSIKFVDIIESVEKSNIFGNEIFTAGGLGKILIFLAEMMSRERIFLRDAYDAKILFSYYENILDVSQLKRKICEYALEESVQSLNCFFDSNELAFHKPVLLKEIAPYGPMSLDRRSAVKRHLAKFFEFQSTRIPLSVVRRSLHLWMERRVLENPNGTLLRRLEGQAFTKKLFSQGILQHGLRLSESPSEDSHDSVINGRWIVSLPLGVFAVSPNALISDHEWDGLCIELGIVTRLRDE